MKFIDFLNESEESIADLIKNVEIYISKVYETNLFVGFNVNKKIKKDDWRKFIKDLFNDEDLYDLVGEIIVNDEGAQFKFEDISDSDLKNIYQIVYNKYDVEFESSESKKILNKIIED